MFLAVVVWLAACKSADQATADNRSTPPPPPALEETTVSASKDTRSSRPSTTRGAAKKSKAAERPMPTPPPPRIATTPTTTTSSGSVDLAMKAPRTAEPPPPRPPSPSSTIHYDSYDSKESVRKSESRVLDRAADMSVKSEDVRVKGYSDPSISETPEAMPPPPRPTREEEKLPKARQLTGGEVNDFSKWDLWTDISQEDLAEHAERWSMLPEKRYAVQVITEEGAPLTNTPVELQTKSGSVLWRAKTDNTGKAELWNKMFDKTNAAAHKIVVNHKAKSYDLKGISIFQEGINTIQIPVACKAAKSQVDIAFVVDATGSMGDEISYLKAELNDVIQRVKDEMPDTRVNLGSVFYRDTGDRYLTQKSDFSTNISKTTDFIKKQNADGGGDYPEAVEDGLDVALNELNWSDESTSRLLFLVLDAPPHTSEEVNKKVAALTKKAAKNGIRIIPVACSGIRKGTEYLMRAMALATNGTYTFLTDHSGIGGSHIEPTTDEYKVELLSDLLVRVITQFSEIPDCDERYDDVIDDIINGQGNQQIVWEYYPNPTKGPFTVKSEENIEEVFVTDLNGKLLMRRTGSRTQSFQLDISDFPSGVYVVKCHFDNDKWETGRIVLVRR